MTTQIPLIKIGQTLTVDESKLPQASQDFIWQYGLRQILNDAMASAKAGKDSNDEAKDSARALAEKRLANLMSGTFRASPIREGDPVRKRALELASHAIAKDAKFRAWLTDGGLKASDKEAVAKLRELATAAIGRDGNRFTAQAEIDVAAVKALEADLDDLDLDFGPAPEGDEPDEAPTPKAKKG